MAALTLALVGFADDQLTLAVRPRLASQAAAGAVLGLILGGMVWALLGGILMPTVVNVVNFMDGINGITALSLAVWAGTAVYVGVANETPALALVGALTAGSTIAFLPWNAPRAQMFLGDVGSYLFGALATGGILVGATSEVPLKLLLAPLALYAADTGFTLIRRMLRGAPLTAAHREHIYQTLVHNRGLSHSAVALIVAGLSIILTLGYVFLPATGATIAAITCTLVYIFLPNALRFRRSPAPPTSRR
ncbi:hypothetical protein [Georgenia wangjunii]|uniref:hypothetical protein n=1 Tax=Georgenia wangjunii TaxID=3117730 RepID=UPI002F262484